MRKKALAYGGKPSGWLWLQEHSDPGDMVVSPNVPQLTYYSERSTNAIPSKRQQYVTELAERRPDSSSSQTGYPVPDYSQEVKHDRIGYAVAAHVRGNRGEVKIILKHRGDWSQLNGIADRL